MKHKRWQVLMVVAFAWVLWWGETKDWRIPRPSWRLLDAFDTYGKCENAASGRQIKMYEDEYGKGKDPEIKVVGFVNKYGETYIPIKKGGFGSFRCFPSTNIDPRK